MKKVATVTFHMAWNYGAILQAYALQQALLGLEYDSEVWNYDCKKISDCYSILDTTGLKAFIKSILMYRSKKKKKKNFKRFVAENIRLTEKITKNNRSEIAKQYNAFIVGSDQVWNYKITGGDGAYFLDFVPERRKRLSYAASFGIKEIPEERKSFPMDLQSKCNSS